jgi:hypothetical protein
MNSQHLLFLEEQMLKKIWYLLGDNWLLILGALGALLLASAAKAANILDCVAHERTEWSVIGSADFVGEPWVYSWTIDQEWDNAAGVWRATTLITHQVAVPGEKLLVTFEDGSTFTYGEPLTETNRAIWGDNLSSLADFGMDGMAPPYVAIKRTTGEMLLLKINDDGGCALGWYLGYAE